jgi:hypothetical protein
MSEPMTTPQYKIIGAPRAKINHSIVHDVVILMSDDEQRTLQQIIADAPDNAVFVEYGCGGSTCLFATQMRPGQHLHSIEHDKDWFLRIRHVLSDIPTSGDVSLYWKPAAEGKTLAYKIGDEVHKILEKDFRVYGSPSEELAHGLEGYIHATDTNIDWSKVHCVLVDGVARGAVLATLRLKLPAGAIVLLHDAANRVWWYRWAVEGVYTTHGLIDNLLVLEVPAK